ncbi:hypothetical protein CMV_004982 [Castanea mollissima]|uniref:Uncharacterized protein n=1 Tax=Castanea mollissima TaxID=60419 RepID=A0A8J4VT47_9ROSI|nr:hypothetical protein CMV_004982 [Castanea mollissima]
MQDQGWAKGCIPESPDSFIESLVQRVDRGRFRFELGGSSNGPRLVSPQEAEIQNNANGQSLKELGFGLSQWATSVRLPCKPTRMLIKMKGIGKLAYNSFPSSHEDFELELQRAEQPRCSSSVSKKGLEQKPNIIFLMETLLAMGKGKDILKTCGFWNGWEYLREGLSGGLLLGWTSNQTVNIQYNSKHLIHADLLDNKGGASSGRKPHFLAIQDALIEAMPKAKELGFNRILTLSNSKRHVQRCNLLGTPSW